MDGIHDIGGKQGFSDIAPTTEEKPFPKRWQGSVFTMVNTLMAHGIAANVDYFRHAIERIDPVSYLSDGYYGRWLGAAEAMLVEAGILQQSEVSKRAQSLGASPEDRVAARPGRRPPFDVNQDAPQPTAQRHAQTPAKYQIGQLVRTVHAGVAGHTRLPGYARDCVGRVITSHGAWVFPDTNAHGLGEQPQHLYTVAFSAQALWGDTTEPGVEVNLDLFEPYLMEEIEA